MFTKSLAAFTAAIAVLLFLQVLKEPIASTPSTALINRIESWLDANTDLPRAAAAPTISFVEPSQIPASTGTASAIGTRTRGLYDPETTTIHLVRPWSATDPQDVSVLLHELLHHRQFVHRVRCSGAQESEAYMHQKKWLAENGQTLNVNWIALRLGANCALRDVHPE